MKKFFKVLIVCLVALSLFSCKAKERSTKTYVDVPEEDKKYTFTFFAFDTQCSITLYGDRMKIYGKSIADELSKIIFNLENNFSKTKEGSDVWRINHRTSNEVMVSRMTSTLFDVAKGLYMWSDGRFDISSGTLVDLWDIKNRKTVPSLSEINEARKHCGNINYTVDFDDESEELLSDKITFNGDMKTTYDLGALVKGFCCDNLKEVISANSEIEAAIINLGGNVCCIGELSSRKGGAFNVGIYKPFSGQELVETVKVKNKCVITSGNYERYFKVDGDDTIYHHILDPKTGFPADTGLNSVTIISENGLLGDYLSTACFLLGAEGSKGLIEYFTKEYDDKDIQAIFVDKNNNVTKYPKKVKTY